jgi:hypothetical protein
MLSYADIDRPLGSIKLRARFELIERRPDRRRTRSAPGRQQRRSQVRKRLLRIGQVSRWPSVMKSANATPLEV